MMNLTKLFLKKLQAGDGVLAALCACDEEIKKRLCHSLESEDVLKYFFDGDGAEAHRQELMEFWDAYKPYRNQVSMKEKEALEIFILNCVYEVDGVSHCDACEKLTALWSGQERQREAELNGLIKQSRNASYICFFRETKGAWQEEHRLELNRLMTRMETFGYFAVRQKLIEYMEQGGVAVIADRPDGGGYAGLTALRLKNRDYRICSEEEAETFREMVTAAVQPGQESYYPKGDQEMLDVLIEQGKE